MSIMTACDSPRERVVWPPPTEILKEGRFPPELALVLATPDGESDWVWTDPVTAHTRPARLSIAGDTWTWRLDSDDDGLPAVFTLTPTQPDLWHAFEIRPDTPAPGAWFPLRRQAVTSPFYYDLVHLLQDLTAPRFDQHVTHWYRTPVPVSADSAISGAVDLRACFRAAVAIWNDSAETPLFSWEPGNALGAHLLHLPGGHLSPPMSASLVQRDDQGRALRLRIRVGDTYDDPLDERYAIRGFVHELAHALLLWGHSLDRDHCLCRYGPMVERPAADERRAVALLQALPAGMDLGRYHRSTEIEAPGHQGQKTTVKHLGLVQETAGRE
jgi:hypothetical protein